ncbi:hypothetical protein IQ07DRAFT_158275 [Pyrenochaeta sp. DS3sAY3a]|nr:hypothetical protein IQ07DRAFT_158275 [Pyrenochaeta sp. DS3sAY3a]
MKKHRLWGRRDCRPYCPSASLRAGRELLLPLPLPLSAVSGVWCLRRIDEPFDQAICWMLCAPPLPLLHGSPSDCGRGSPDVAVQVGEGLTAQRTCQRRDDGQKGQHKGRLATRIGRQ